MGFRVSIHAIEMYRKRMGSKRSNEIIKEKILSQLEKAQEMQLKKKFRIIALLSHDFEDTRYFKTKNGQIVVVVDNVVKTIHNGTANRWEKM